MGTPRPYTPHKLVLPALLGCKDVEDAVVAELEAEFGEIDRIGPGLPFTATRYYEQEMGGELVRVFWTARALVMPEELARIKIATNEIEQRLARGGRRRVNIDPGLLSLSRFVLASTKDSSHRIPLHSGIYAEVTLVYAKGEFRPLEWTYPDYRSPEYREILAEIRRRYRPQLASQSQDPVPW